MKYYTWLINQNYHLEQSEKVNCISDIALADSFIFFFFFLDDVFVNLDFLLLRVLYLWSVRAINLFLILLAR